MLLYVCLWINAPFGCAPRETQKEDPGIYQQPKEKEIPPSLLLIWLLILSNIARQSG